MDGALSRQEANRAIRVPFVVPDVKPYKAETVASLGSMAAGGISTLGAKTPLMKGIFATPGAFFLGANVRGRGHQMRITNRILNNPRAWDRQVGVPEKLGAEKLAGAQEVLRGLQAFARHPLSSSNRGVFRAVSAAGGNPSANATRNIAEDVARLRRRFQTPDPHSVTRGFDRGTVDDLARKTLQQQLRRTQPMKAIIPGIDPRAFRKAASLDSILARLPEQLGGRAVPKDPENLREVLELVLPKLRKDLAPILSKAAVLPLGIGAVFAMDQAYKGGRRMQNRAAEGSRFSKAMGDLRPGDFGSADFEERFGENPQEMLAGMREQFRVLNQVAPAVASNPVVAREFMRRMMLDPNYKVPPEQYLRTFGEAVSLENALQSAQPSLFEGIGSTVGTVIKGGS